MAPRLWLLRDAARFKALLVGLCGKLVAHGEQLGQGRENAKKYLTENPEVMVEISDRVWKAVMPDEEEATDVTDVDEDEEFSDADDMPIALDD